MPRMFPEAHRAVASSLTHVPPWFFVLCCLSKPLVWTLSGHFLLALSSLWMLSLPGLARSLISVFLNEDRRSLKWSHSTRFCILPLQMLKRKNEGDRNQVGFVLTKMGRGKWANLTYTGAGLNEWVLEFKSVEAKNGNLGKDKRRLKMDYYSIEHIKSDGSIGGFGSNAAKSL